MTVETMVRIAAAHGRDAAQDSRYAVRVLARSPGFLLAAAACLAIGIGLTAAMYGTIQSTVLRPIPGVQDSIGLVRLHKPIAFADSEELDKRSDLFVSLAAYTGPVPVALRREGHDAERVWAHLTTPDYFDVLGVQSARGRFFAPDERIAGAGNVAIISDRLWKTRFGGDESIAGRTVRSNGQLLTIVGVAPVGFLGASPMTAAADIWIPTSADPRAAPELARLHEQRTPAFEVIGRLAPGVTLGQVEAAADWLMRRLEIIHNDPNKDSQEPRVRLLPGGRMFPVRNEDLPRAIGFPLLLVGLVLVMASGNVANLVLARSAARRREIAVRLSLGASRGRIVRQLLTESFMLVALGAMGGALFALWLLSTFDVMRPMLPGYVQYELMFDWRALAVATLVAGLSTLLFGLAPALRASRDDISAGLKPAGASYVSGRHWLSVRNLLVFQQVTVSMILLLLTGFIVVGWQRVANVNVGFDTTNPYFVSLDPVRDGYPPERARQFFELLPDRLGRTPGIASVSLAQTLPLALSSMEMILNVKSDFAAGTQLLGATRVDRIGVGFFETVGTPLRRGRAFAKSDEREESRVLIVNETLAAKAWPGSDPIGQVVDLDGESWQVIGVVGDFRSAFPLAPTLPGLYKPVTAAGFTTPARHGVTVAVRVVPGFDAPTQLRRQIASLDPDVTVLQVKRMTDDIDQALFFARLATFAYGGMGVFGLMLASIGLAGVTAYAVSRRTQEIGIRMALGAQRAGVLWLVLRDGSLIILFGTVAGLLIALAATIALSSFVETLAQTTSTTISDPILLIGGPALLAGIALTACWLPARRATRIDPISALRSE